MASSIMKQFLIIFVLISSFASVVFSQGENSGSGEEIPDCIKKIITCATYIRNPNPPPPSCCKPLVELVKDDIKCLCSVFNNAAFLKAFNVTKKEALKLPQNCGAHVNMNTCKHLPPTGLTPLPSPPATPSNCTTSSSNGGSSSRERSVYGIGYGLAAATTLFLGFSLLDVLHFY